MATLKDIKQWVGRTLREFGFRGSGTSFYRCDAEVQWIIHLDRPPYGEYIGVEIGLELQTETRPKSAMYCGSTLYLEFLPFANVTEFRRVFDVRSDLPDEQRHDEVVAAIRALGDYLAGLDTVEAVRAAYDRGDFRGSAVGIRTMEALGLEIPETPVVKEKPKIVYINLTKPAG